MPAAFGMELHAPLLFIFSADRFILNVLEAGEAIRNRAHVAAALDVILSAQRADAAAVTAHVSGKDRKIDERYNVVHGIVVLGDSQSPAKLRAVCLGISMGRLADHFRRDAGFTF